MQTTTYNFCERVHADTDSSDEDETAEDATHVELMFDVAPEQQLSSPIRIQMVQHPSADFGSFTWPARCDY
jgi:hypothetical protein